MKFILDVPYVDKDEAKVLGARWDMAKRVWYVPLDRQDDLTDFARWFPKPKEKAPRVDSFQGPTTEPAVHVASCACDVLPWDDCEHTRDVP